MQGYREQLKLRLQELVNSERDRQAQELSRLRNELLSVQERAQNDLVRLSSSNDRQREELMVCYAAAPPMDI